MRRSKEKALLHYAVLIFVFSIGIWLGKRRAESDFQSERLTILNAAKLAPREPASISNMESCGEVVDAIKKSLDKQTEQFELFNKSLRNSVQSKY